MTRETVRTSALKTRAIANPTVATMKIGRTSLTKIEEGSSVAGRRYSSGWRSVAKWLVSEAGQEAERLRREGASRRGPERGLERVTAGVAAQRHGVANRNVVRGRCEEDAGKEPETTTTVRTRGRASATAPAIGMARTPPPADLGPSSTAWARANANETPARG